MCMPSQVSRGASPYIWPSRLNIQNRHIHIYNHVPSTYASFQLPLSKRASQPSAEPSSSLGLSWFGICYKSTHTSWASLTFLGTQISQFPQRLLHPPEWSTQHSFHRKPASWTDFTRAKSSVFDRMKWTNWPAGPLRCPCAYQVRCQGWKTPDHSVSASGRNGAHWVSLQHHSPSVSVKQCWRRLWGCACCFSLARTSCLIVPFDNSFLRRRLSFGMMAMLYFGEKSMLPFMWPFRLQLLSSSRVKV